MNYHKEWKTVVFVKSFSGAKLRRIEGYVQPTLREMSRHVILNVGTNAVTTKQDPQQIAERVLLNHAPSSTQLHPPPSSSFQPPPNSIHLHPAHFSLHPALCNILDNIWTKILHALGQFPQIKAEN